MKNSNWFKHIRVGSLRRRIIQFAYLKKKRTGNYNLLDEKPNIKPVDLALLYRERYGRHAIVQGKRTKLFSLRDISNLYGLSYLTVLRWYQKGFLPEPYLERKAGRGRSPLYLTVQMRVIVKVLNDLFGQGLKSLVVSRLTEHKEMMDRGNEIVIDKFLEVSKKDIKRSIGGESGVVWE